MAREPFAARCATTVGYLRNACSTKKKMSEGLCLRISTESAGAVRPEDLRPDVDWDYMRTALLSQPAVEDRRAVQDQTVA